MKRICFLLLFTFFMPGAVFAAGNEFDGATKLLAAAKNGNIQQVQMLIASGANVNYVDSTGLSVVCTAIMNNDTRAAQILQMYGADASRCDRQIKQYKSRNAPIGNDSGVFGGLSTTHGLVLAAGATAAVVGGLFLLTDVFDPGDGNKNNNSGTRPGGSGGSGDNSVLSPAYTVPYSPAYVNTNTGKIDTASTNYNINLTMWDGSNDTTNSSVYSWDFNYFRPESQQTNNYIDDGVASIITYKGQSVLDKSVPNYLLMMGGYSPLAHGYLGQNIFRTDLVPNVMENSAQGGVPVIVAAITGNGVSPTGSLARGDGILYATSSASNSETYTVDKFVNYDTLGAEVTGFDLSGAGTAMNMDASAYDNALGKIIAGWNPTGDEDVRAVGDFLGFVPYGRLAIYRTGNGYDLSDSENPVATDYKNWQAMFAANNLYQSTASVDGRIFAAIANINLIPTSYNISYLNTETVVNIIGVSPDTAKNNFKSEIDSVYDRNNTETMTQGDYANQLFSYVPGDFAPILVMPAGEFKYGDGSGQSLAVLDATFENYAPVLYGSTLHHRFMTVVAVNQDTTGFASISDYGDGSSKKVSLSAWTDGDDIFRSRKCGITGRGTSSLDPWCFAAAGATSEMATAAAAGAVAAVKGAFNYMTYNQIFTLLALTADGFMLGADSYGNAYTAATLTGYLQSKYSLPNETRYNQIVRANYTSDDSYYAAYLDAFADVYGYGLINLTRATKPNTSVYYRDGNRIKSVSGNSYWRAASQSAFRPSGALNPRGATIKMSAYDILTSADGTISLPRVWNNSFALNTDSWRHALYMGDVLGELSTRRVDDNHVQIGEFGFSMSRSNRAYADNMNGLESMRVDWTSGRWNLAAGYQHYLTDGAVRFTAMSNPILNLAHDAVVSDAEFVAGRWSFGGRAFSGRITDDGLLENDPAISENYAPARLGGISGVAANIGWHADNFSFATSVGGAHESDTILGARTDGLLALGQGDTIYVDSEMRYNILSDLTLTARATFAQTHASGGEFISDVSDLYSNAFGIGAQWRGLSVAAAMPLGVYRGYARYPYAEYSVNENENGGYDLAMSNAGLSEIDMRPDSREVRFSATYMRPLGEFTDGAVGFIYRVNPNHTNEFGNESVFMLKLHHRIGI